MQVFSTFCLTNFNMTGIYVYKLAQIRMLLIMVVLHPLSSLYATIQN